MLYSFLNPSDFLSVYRNHSCSPEYIHAYGNPVLHHEESHLYDRRQLVLLGNAFLPQNGRAYQLSRPVTVFFIRVCKIFFRIVVCYIAETVLRVPTKPLSHLFTDKTLEVIKDDVELV